MESKNLLEQKWFIKALNCSETEKEKINSNLTDVVAIIKKHQRLEKEFQPAVTAAIKEFLGRKE